MDMFLSAPKRPWRVWLAESAADLAAAMMAPETLAYARKIHFTRMLTGH
jgi:hypothetical protein